MLSDFNYFCELSNVKKVCRARHLIKLCSSYLLDVHLKCICMQYWDFGLYSTEVEANLFANGVNNREIDVSKSIK